MRIALDCRCVFRGMGGIGRYTRSLLDEYLQIGEEHHFVCYFTQLPLPAELPSAPNTTCRCFEAGMIDERFDQLVLPSLLEEDEIDIYHNPTFAVPAIRGNARVVSTVHDVVFARFPELVEPRLREYLDSATRRACRTADRIVTVSEFSRREILALYPARADRLQVIPNGVHPPPSRAVSENDSSIRSLGLSPGQFVLYVGSIEPKKNLGLLVDAVSDLKRRGLFLGRKLVLAGSMGPGGDLLLGRIRACLEEDAVITGHVSEDVLEALYASAAVFVYPSLYEGFGLPPLEAMLRGVPTVVADSSSLPEVVGDGALIVPRDSPSALATAIDNMFGDKEGRRQVIARGRGRAERFNWRSSAEAHLRLYRDVLARDQRNSTLPRAL